jgi:calcineurin-like phosphoesterase family protein
MDGILLDRHYETVDSEDTLVHLGDVAMDMQDGRKTIERFEQLDGDLLIRGNHDVGLTPSEAPFPVVESCVLAHDDYEFYCTHRPENVPDSWDGWAINDHRHNNDTEQFPFVAGQERRVNVSAELLDYRPVALDALVDLLDACDASTRLRDASQARAWLDDQRDGTR